jgi:glycosyltransferase involved in cell wall biosynthesis
MEQSIVKNNYSISVVIPVYNGEKYLRDCIDSILAQSFRDFEIFEIVMVDDGSRDSSGQICDEYAAMHDNIHVYHKANEGINQTRRYGVRVAQGEWIAFSDQDDSMPIDALQSLWDKHEDTDMVIGFPDTPVHKRELNLEECRENAITAKLFPPTPWAKLYRKELLTDDVFDFPREIDGEEDMIMNIRLMFRINRAPHFVFKKVYNFRRNANSVSHTKRASLEHEDLFDRVRAQSIPANEIQHYMNSILQSRLNGLTSPAFSEPKTLCNKQHPYMKRLCEDIKHYSYTMNFQEWMLLNIPYAWMYKAFSYLVMVKNFSRYHLGLNN